MSTRREFWANRPFPAGKASRGAFLLLGALALQWASWTVPSWVEEAYSRGLYPGMVAFLAGVSSWFPFSLAELGLTLGFLALAAQIWSKFRSWRRGDRSLGNILVSAAGMGLFFAGVGFSVFLLLWGFNYGRLPLGTMLAYPEGPVLKEELAALKAELVAMTSERRKAVPEDAQGVAAWGGTDEEILAQARAAVVGWMRGKAWEFSFRAAPKFALLSPALSTLGITGIYCPFTGESHGNGQIPAVEKPFVLCHEIAHAYGFAREDEANFVAAMACREHDDAFFRYSGAFSSLNQFWSVPFEEPSLAGYRRDLKAVRDFWDRVRNRSYGPVSGKLVMEISHKVNDGYLKSQGQRDGARSYDRMIELLVRERRARLR